jgi:hypothetical protein
MQKDLLEIVFIIAGLLHDIRKASKLYYDETDLIRYRHFLIKRHGNRPLKLLERFELVLPGDERLAIRWQMGGHHASESVQEEVMRARNSLLWMLIHREDHLELSGKTEDAIGAYR